MHNQNQKKMKYKALIFLLTFINGINYCQTLTEFDLITISDEKINSLSFFNVSQENAVFQTSFKDSIRITFKTVNDDIYNIWLETDTKKYRKQFILGEGIIKVYFKITDNKLSIEEVTGSDIYYEQKKYLNAMSSVKDLSDSLYTLYHKEMFLKHQKSPFSIIVAHNYIAKNQNNTSNLTWLTNQMNDQNPSIKKHFTFEGAYNRAKSLIDIRELKIYEFDVVDKIGVKTNIEKSNHDFTILDFWFVHCPPCIKDHKTIQERYNRLVTNDRSIRIVGVSTDQDFKLWSNYLLESNFQWENFLIDTASENNLAKYLNISTFPTYVILGKNQEILINTNSLEKVFSYVNLKTMEE